MILLGKTHMGEEHVNGIRKCDDKLVVGNISIKSNIIEY